MGAAGADGQARAAQGAGEMCDIGGELRIVRKFQIGKLYHPAQTGGFTPPDPRGIFSFG